MAVFGGFSGRKSKSISRSIAIIVVAILMVVLSITYILPNDLFTSALFFDNIGLQPVFSQPSGLFAEGGIWEDLPDISVEAASFSVFLFLVQIMAGYQANAQGSWSKNSNNIIQLLSLNRKNARVAEFNWEKLGWTTMYWVVAMFDTFTDTSFRSWFGAHGFMFNLRALIVSLLYYNLFSEWALSMGITAIMSSGADVLREMGLMSTRRANEIPDRQQGTSQDYQNVRGGIRQRQR